MTWGMGAMAPIPHGNLPLPLRVSRRFEDRLAQGRRSSPKVPAEGPRSGAKGKAERGDSEAERRMGQGWGLRRAVSASEAC
jgi:hypothetical protein